MRMFTLISFVLNVLNLLLIPLATMLMWNWFVVPVTSFKILSPLEAFGVNIFFAMLLIPSLQIEDEDEAKVIYKRIAQFVTRLASLFVGWVLHLLMQG